jgi:hypothetical protein
MSNEKGELPKFICTEEFYSCSDTVGNNNLTLNIGNINSIKYIILFKIKLKINICN